MLCKMLSPKMLVSPEDSTSTPRWRTWRPSLKPRRVTSTYRFT